MLKSHLKDERKKIPVGAWHAPDPQFVTKEVYKDIVDCGFTFILTYYERGDDGIDKTLDMCAEVGLDYIVGDWVVDRHDEHMEETTRHIDRYKDHPAFVGNKIKDEPGASEFARLAKLHNVYKKAYPDKLCYINLFNTYAGPKLLQTETYYEHVEKYIQTVKPEFVSFDHYPLIELEGSFGITKDFIENFDICAYLCKKYKLPLWFFVQVIGFNNYWRFPAYHEIMWQIYVALAYGTKVIQCFCYQTPPNYGEIFHYAILDRDGIKTHQYGRVKKAINELRGFDAEYLEYDYKGTMVITKTGDEDYLKADYSIKSFDTVSVEENSQPLLVGCFEKKSGKAIIMVNMTDPGLDLWNSSRIKLEGISCVTVYIRGLKQKRQLTDNILDIDLSPGEGIFLEF